MFHFDPLSDLFHHMFTTDERKKLYKKHPELEKIQK